MLAKKLQSLRTRITLVSGITVVVMALLLTILYLYMADQIFVYQDYYAAIQAESLNNPEDFELQSTLLTEIENLQTLFQRRSILVMCAGIFTACLLLSLFIREFLKPLQKMAKQVAQLDASSLAQRLPRTKNESTELKDFRLAFNRLLQRLERAFLSQKRFSHNVAHELKTPLAAMTLELDLMEADSQDEKQLETLKELQIQTHALSEIVSGLLSLHDKLERLDVETLALKEIFEGILKDYKEAIAEKQIHIELQGQMKVQANRTLFIRALSNLVQNAIRYNCSQGHIHIILSADSCRISNSGAQIKEDEREAIFEPFYCCDPSRSKAAGGYGLGLSITKHILESFHYEIQVEVPSQETTFLITPSA